MYCPKLKGLFETLKKYSYHEIPMLIDGYLNLDLRRVYGSEFIELIRTEVGLELSNDLGTSTSLNWTCIDAVF